MLCLTPTPPVTAVAQHVGSKGRHRNAFLSLPGVVRWRKVGGMEEGRWEAEFDNDIWIGHGTPL